MSLALLVGPANAGKVANLLDRYVAALDRDPCLVVPNRGEVERVERDLLTRVPALLGGWLPAPSTASVRGSRAASRARPFSRRYSGRSSSGVWPRRRRSRSSALQPASQGSAMPSATRLRSSSRLLSNRRRWTASSGACRAYRVELERLGAVDRELLAGRAAAAVGGDFAAWSGAPVFVYGFEDRPAHSGRCSRRSPGGARWSSHSRTSPAVPRSRPSSGSLTTSPGSRTGRPTSCLLRTGTTPRRWRTSSGCSSRIATSSRRRSRCGALPRGGGQAWRARAGRRGGHSGLLRDGVEAADIGIIVPSVDHMRAPLETAFGALGVPYAVEGSRRLARTPFGRACRRCCASPGSGADGRISTRFSVLRTQGFPRSQVDFAEAAYAGGRCRSRKGSRRRRCD